MTKSERLCNEIGRNLFFNDYVFENLKCFDDTNNRIEICDALFQYCETYLVVQIKERKNCSGEIDKEYKWLNDVIEIAAKQITKSLKLIKSDKIITINDSYHQATTLNNNYTLIPIIIFDNPFLESYEKVILVNDVLVNVFSLDDFSSVIKATIHPFRLFDYLENRAQFFFEKQTNDLPHLFIEDSDKGITISKIKNESDFVSAFNATLLCDVKSISKLMRIIEKFKSKMLSNNPQYKKILRLLQFIRPEQSKDFVDRFDLTRNEAMNKIEAKNKALIEIINNVKTGIVFVSSGDKKYEEEYINKLLIEAKSRMKIDNVLIILFSYYSSHDFNADWIYWENF